MNTFYNILFNIANNQFLININFFYFLKLHLTSLTITFTIFFIINNFIFNFKVNFRFFLEMIEDSLAFEYFNNKNINLNDVAYHVQESLQALKKFYLSIIVIYILSFYHFVYLNVSFFF